MKIGLARMLGGLYHMELSHDSGSKSSLNMLHTSLDSITCNNAVTIPNSALWHFRLGHASLPLIQKLANQVPYIHCENIGVWDVCHFAKQKRTSFPISKSKASKPFELMHLDIWGPYSITSIHNHKYFLTIVDDLSRFTWIVLLKGKFDVQLQVQNFILLVETQFGASVKQLRTDNGPEFALPSFYASKGILHQTSCVATPQQNAGVERKHQHILNVARALFFQAKLPKKYWCYAVQHAVFFINRVPSKVLNYQTAHQLLFGETPDLSELRTFGCLCFMSTHADTHKTKFDSRSIKCLFLGYKAGTKGYVVLDLKAYTIHVTRDVAFHELIFPYETHTTATPWQYLDHSSGTYASAPTTPEPEIVPLTPSPTLPPHPTCNTPIPPPRRST